MVEAEMKHSLPPERQMEPRSRLDKKWVVRENKSDTSGWDGISMCNRRCPTVFKHRFTNDDNREDGKSSKGRQRINKLFPFCLFHGEVSCSWNDSQVSLLLWPARCFWLIFRCCAAVVIQKLLHENSGTLAGDAGLAAEAVTSLALPLHVIPALEPEL